MKDNKHLIPKERTDWTKILLAFTLGGLLWSMAFSILIFSGHTDSFMTDGKCKEITNNETIDSFNYGTEYVISRITEQAIQCQQIPINYSNYSYTLYPLECLDINSNQGGK